MKNETKKFQVSARLGGKYMAGYISGSINESFTKLLNKVGEFPGALAVCVGVRSPGSKEFFLDNDATKELGNLVESHLKDKGLAGSFKIYVSRGL